MAVYYVKNFFKLFFNSFSTKKVNISRLFYKKVEKYSQNINMLKN